MAAPIAVPPARRRRSKFFLKILLSLVLLGVAAVAGLGWWAFHVERAALPQLDGEVYLSGLSAPVTVVRDNLGVPHINAANIDDLAFAQGYVTAQDRLWQMDIVRRYARGELSEVLGKGTLKVDKRMRILGLRQVAEQSTAALDPTDRRILDDYARGVNAYLEASRDRLPLEFRVLGYQPHPWTAADSLLMGPFMANMLSGDLFDVEIAKERILSKLGPEMTNWLYDTASWRDHAPGDDAPPPQPAEETPASEEGLLNLPHSQATAILTRRAFAVIDGPVPGSNEWAVAGSKTASGKPLLSNDMHLPHQRPNIWYMVDLKAGNFHVAGVSVPGAPFVIVGHNDHIAWGITNLGPEIQDLFIENFNEKGEYQTPTGWLPAQHRREVIHVKGEADIVLDVVTTRHGPIVTDIIPGETRKLALRWTLYDPGAIVLPFFKLNAAGNWNEFRDAWRDFSLPACNVIYADDQGHIGYQATGHIPIRTQPTNFLPVPGADDAHEWTGYIPFDKLPSVEDPPSGVLATANARITPEGYPYYVTAMWEKPYRTERIYHVLMEGSKLTPADMLKLQTDVYSDFDRFLAQRFVYSIDHTATATARDKQAAEILRAWNGEIAADSAAPTIVLRVQNELWELLLASRIGAGVVKPVDEQEQSRYQWWRANVAMEKVLIHQPPSFLPPGYASYDALLTAAVDRAINAKGVPSDLSKWTWGSVSTIRVGHPIFDRIPLLNRWTGTARLPQSGDSNTVKQVGRSFGPSERMTVDFADLDGSTLNIVNGESGNFLSPHYDDQWPAWYGGTTFPWPWSDAAVGRAARHTLTLRERPR